MKEKNTFVDTMFTSMTADLAASARIVSKPAVILWERLEEERNVAKRQIVRTLTRPLRKYVW